MAVSAIAVPAPSPINHASAYRESTTAVLKVLDKPEPPLHTWNETILKPQLVRRDAQIAEVARLKKEAEDAAIAAQKAAEAAKAAAQPKVAPVALPAAVAPADIQAMINKWGAVYGVDPAWLSRVINCESHFNSNAINGKYWAGGSTPSGVSQFLASTYIANAARIGLPARDDRFNPDNSIHVMAWMFSIGQWVQWECR